MACSGPFMDFIILLLKMASLSLHVMTRSDPFWSVLFLSDHFWSILIRSDSFWPVRTGADPFWPFQYLIDRLSASLSQSATIHSTSRIYCQQHCFANSCKVPSVLRIRILSVRSILPFWHRNPYNFCNLSFKVVLFVVDFIRYCFDRVPISLSSGSGTKSGVPNVDR
jgi:hypothetical protein